MSRLAEMIVLLALALVASACTGSGKSEGSSAARPSPSAQVAGLEVSSLPGTPRALAVVDGEVWVALVRQVTLDDQPGPVSSPLDALISRKDLVVAHPGADKIYRIPLAALLSETS